MRTATLRRRGLLLAVVLVFVPVLLSPPLWLVHRVYFERDGVPDLEAFLRFEPPTPRTALPVFREIMQRVYEGNLVGPAPRFPREIEAGIDRYLAMQAVPEVPAGELHTVEIAQAGSCTGREGTLGQSVARVWGAGEVVSSWTALLAPGSQCSSLWGSRRLD